jgi:hypothetical protein
VEFGVFTVTGLEVGAGGGSTTTDLSDNSMEGKGLDTESEHGRLMNEVHLSY